MRLKHANDVADDNRHDHRDCDSDVNSYQHDVEYTNDDRYDNHHGHKLTHYVAVNHCIIFNNTNNDGNHHSSNRAIRVLHV